MGESDASVYQPSKNLQQTINITINAPYLYTNPTCFPVVIGQPVWQRRWVHERFV